MEKVSFLDVLVSVSRVHKAKLEEELRNKSLQSDQQNLIVQPQPQPKKSYKRKRVESGNLVSTDDRDNFARARVSGMMKSKAKKSALKLKKMNKVGLGDNVQKVAKRKKKTAVETVSDEIPDLSTEFKIKIYEKARGGLVEEEILVIQKELTATDLGSRQNRLSIPFRNMRNNFLSNKDAAFLEERDEAGHCNHIYVDIIEPMGEVETVSVRRWEMKKLKGNPSISYVLNDNWSRIVVSNQLKVGDMVQLWAVKINGKICLVFVKLS